MTTKLYPFWRRRPSAVVCAALVATLFSAACGAPADSSQPEGAGPDHVRVMTGSLKSISASGLLMLAQDTGRFQHYGVEVELVSAKSSVVATQALTTGDVEFAAIGTADAWLAGARQDPILTPVKLFGGVSTSLVVSRAIADVGSADAPLADRLRALNGRTIATVSARSNTTGILRIAMASVGGAVRETFMDQPTMVSAFQSGQIDGFMATSPSVDEVVSSGSGVLWVDGPAGEYPATGDSFFHVTLAATKDYVDGNRDAVQRIVAALLDASDMVEKQPDEAGRVLRARFPELDERLWASVWAQNGSSLGDARPTAEDIAPAVATVVPDDARQAVEESLDPAVVLATEQVEGAERLRTNG